MPNEAHAPYNFVSLPQQSLDVREQFNTLSLANALPAHNIYLPDPDRRHGYFEVKLTTETPLYIRGMLKASDVRDHALKKAQNPEIKKLETPYFFQPNGTAHIPSSSLRGMLRNLLEIITFSKLAPITQQQLFYRTVDDSVLGKEYSRRMTGKVEAGFLEHNVQTGNYQIRRTQMVRIDRDLLGSANDLYEGKNAPNKTPKWVGKWHQYQQVWVKLDDKHHNRVESIQDEPNTDYLAGILVITGDMPGIDKKTNKPKKQREFVFLLPDEDTEIVEVDEEKIKRFHDDDQISQWQQKAFPVDQPRKKGRDRKGLLMKQPHQYENPLFFLRENGTLAFFGRAGMFRLPYINSPDKLLSSELRNPATLDFAEALFGFVRKPEEAQALHDTDPNFARDLRAYTGRVSITDAHLPAEQTNIYEDIITPPVLSTPKPTTFQHYLKQTTTDRKKMDHYDTRDSHDKPKAELRGHKLYWRQRLDSTTNIHQRNVDVAKSTQHTQIQAVKPTTKEYPIEFSFRVYFENLTDVELGALVWVLRLGGDKQARHMLGMGKPFGMGIVKLEPTLYLCNRRQRYEELFTEEGDWATGYSPEPDDLTEYQNKFIEFMDGWLKKLSKKETNFDEQKRIQELNAILKLREREETSTAEAGRKTDLLFDYMILDEFRYRPLLLPILEVATQEEERSQKRKGELELVKIEQKKIEQVQRIAQVGDIIRGRITDKPKHPDDPVEFRPLDLDPEKYRGNIMAEHRQGEYQKRQVVTVQILEIEEYKGGFSLWCRPVSSDQ